MRDHPHIPGLGIHDDDELPSMLGAGVVSRRTVHEWPLTRTEELRLADGRRLAYKTQLPPSVEPRFYERARSPLLTRCTDLGPAGAGHAIATAWIDAPTLLDLTGDHEAYIAQAIEVAAGVASVGGDPEVYLDLAATWSAAARTTGERLRRQIHDRRFRRISSARVDRFDAWADRPETISAVAADPVIAHGDLTPDEVFVVGVGRERYRVIDWQRPVRGPRGIDLVSLLRAARIDPSDHVEAVVVGVEAFLLLHWAALAATELLPEAPPEFFEGWALGALDRVLGPA